MRECEGIRSICVRSGDRMNSAKAEDRGGRAFFFGSRNGFGWPRVLSTKETHSYSIGSACERGQGQ
jgi:hypothetical protein